MEDDCPNDGLIHHQFNNLTNQCLDNHQNLIDLENELTKSHQKNHQHQMTQMTQQLKHQSTKYQHQKQQVADDLKFPTQDPHEHNPMLDRYLKSSSWAGDEFPPDHHPFDKEYESRKLQYHLNQHNKSQSISDSGYTSSQITPHFEREVDWSRAPNFNMIGGNGATGVNTGLTPGGMSGANVNPIVSASNYRIDAEGNMVYHPPMHFAMPGNYSGHQNILHHQQQQPVPIYTMNGINQHPNLRNSSWDNLSIDKSLDNNLITNMSSTPQEYRELEDDLKSMKDQLEGVIARLSKINTRCDPIGPCWELGTWIRWSRSKPLGPLDAVCDLRFSSTPCSMLHCDSPQTIQQKYKDQNFKHTYSYAQNLGEIKEFLGKKPNSLVGRFEIDPGLSRSSSKKLNARKVPNLPSYLVARNLSAAS